MIASLEDFKTWIGVTDSLDDAVMQAALDAAEEYMRTRCDLPAPAPADAVEAQYLLAARWLARRNSPDGLVGVTSEFGPARIASVDQDVTALISPYVRVIFA